jgi:D-serine deaminase-like pyridoxal phosphate-dependent protein
MTDISELPTPALLLDLDRLETNLRAMAARCDNLGVALRPHIKTHKCVEIGKLQRDLGALGITVSTLQEARVFAEHGFDDITWAFPVIPSRIGEAAELASKVILRLVIDSVDALTQLESAGFPFHVWLKVDCGYHRAGIDPGSYTSIELAQKLQASRTLSFDGILTHSGHSYHARGKEMIRHIAEEERRIMVEFSDRLRAERDIVVPQISVGSTPAMSAVEHLTGVTEARPGNYALYDYSQTIIGSCTTNHCAASVLASVVSCQPGANHSIIDAGALALSKDAGPDDVPQRTMGEIFDDYAGASLSRESRVVAVSQEHGTVRGRLTIGTKVRVLPNHACLAVAQFDEFHVVRGNEVVDKWRIWRVR